MSDVAAVKSLVTKYNALRQEVAKVIIGQDDVVNQILILNLCIFSDEPLDNLSKKCILLGDLK